MSNKKENEAVMTYSQLNEFYNAITHLGSLPLLDLDLMISVSKTRSIIKSEVELFNEIYKAFSEETCMKDFDGKPLIGEGNRLLYECEQEEKLVLLKVEELNSKKVEVKINKFNVSKLKDIKGVTSNMLSALEEMIIY